MKLEVLREICNGSPRNLAEKVLPAVDAEEGTPTCSRTEVDAHICASGTHRADVLGRFCASAIERQRRLWKADSRICSKVVYRQL